MGFIACHDEKIHVPGHIQSFGFSLGLDFKTKQIKFLSENLSEIFLVDKSILGGRLEDFPDVFAPILSSYTFNNLDENIEKEADINIDKVFLKDVPYHFTSFRSGDNVFLQFEKKLEVENERNYISRKYENINSAATETEIWKQLLTAFGDYVNYDRMMVYKFLEDGSGMVIAENKKDEIESYLHLHYPESDIPRQARELYLKKRKRILSNADMQPVPILSKTEEKIDLTYSNLRAMSPVHNQYLKNGGATSSFSTSIIVNGKLWGLVTCQNIKPKHIDFDNRVRAEVFTLIAANTYTALKANQILEHSKEQDKKNAVLLNKFLDFDDLDSALFANIDDICQYPEADGVAIVIADKIVTAGSVPSDAHILRIKNWLKANVHDNFFVSNEFRNLYFPEIENAAGLGIAYIDKSKKELLLWFKKELQEDILWAGNPEKTFEPIIKNGEEKMMVSPRKSFEIYRESVKGKSAPWKNRDVLAMKNVVEIILGASHNQFVKVKELVDELKEVNDELDSFSYTVSHDLGTPLTVMKMNAQLLLRKNNGDENLKKKLGDIISEIDGMAEMMQNVLQLSKSKSQEIALEEMSPKILIEKINSDSKSTYGSAQTEFILNDFPAVLADKTMLYQIFLNVISNAVKYSAKNENPLVKIGGEIIGDSVVYRISDNGIGIQKDQEEKMFKVFSRMDNAKGFKGNGVGLSIVNRLMLRLGGSISYESVPDQGTTFALKFQKP